MDSSKKGGGIAMLVVVLGLITFVCAFALGAINQITAPQIELNQTNTRNEAMSVIIPDVTFTDLETTVAATDTDAEISGVYQGTAADGSIAGYCVEVKPKGFGGQLTMIVGVLSDGTIAGVQVTSHSETPGLGAKAQSDAAWIAQYEGAAADGSLAVTKDGGTINAITGATITSRAVTLGVNTAAKYVASLG